MDVGWKWMGRFSNIDYVLLFIIFSFLFRVTATAAEERSKTVLEENPATGLFGWSVETLRVDEEDRELKVFRAWESSGERPFDEWLEPFNLLTTWPIYVLLDDKHRVPVITALIEMGYPIEDHPRYRGNWVMSGLEELLRTGHGAVKFIAEKMASAGVVDVAVGIVDNCDVFPSPMFGIDTSDSCKEFPAGVVFLIHNRTIAPPDSKVKASGASPDPVGTIEEGKVQTRSVLQVIRPDHPAPLLDKLVFLWEREKLFVMSGVDPRQIIEFVDWIDERIDSLEWPIHVQLACAIGVPMMGDLLEMGYSLGGDPRFRGGWIMSGLSELVVNGSGAVRVVAKEIDSVGVVDVAISNEKFGGFYRNPRILLHNRPLVPDNFESRFPKGDHRKKEEDDLCRRCLG